MDTQAIRSRLEELQGGIGEILQEIDGAEAETDQGGNVDDNYDEENGIGVPEDGQMDALSKFHGKKFDKRRM